MTLPETASRLSEVAGANADLSQPLLDAEPAMHLHGVRALLDAGADARERLGLLVDHRLDDELAQRRRDGEPADAGADDGQGGGRTKGHHCISRADEAGS